MKCSRSMNQTITLRPSRHTDAPHRALACCYFAAAIVSAPVWTGANALSAVSVTRPLRSATTMPVDGLTHKGAVVMAPAGAARVAARDGRAAPCRRTARRMPARVAPNERAFRLHRRQEQARAGAGRHFPSCFVTTAAPRREARARAGDVVRRRFDQTWGRASAFGADHARQVAGSSAPNDSSGCSKVSVPGAVLPLSCPVKLRARGARAQVPARPARLVRARLDRRRRGCPDQRDPPRLRDAHFKLYYQRLNLMRRWRRSCQVSRHQFDLVSSTA